MADLPEESTWVVYPWNVIEDVVDLVTGAMEREDAATFHESTVRRLLADHHGIERIQTEIAQPGRLGEAVRRGELVEGDGGYQLA